jgi:electron transfer flavoprotein beta subunit
MKVVVAVKRVVDYNVRIRVKADHSDVDIQHAKMSMNPFDEIAIEEAVRLKEAGIATEIIAVSIGDPSCQETLRTALAFGADRGILIQTQPEQTLQPLNIAKLLQKIVAQEQPQLVITGKQAIDDDANQTGQMLAGLLNWAQGTFISKLTIKDNHAEVVREIDGGLETLRLKLPAVVTTDLRLNQPRYISLPNIMKAKQKPISVVMADSLNVDIQPTVKTIKVEPPTPRKSGIKVQTVLELINLLKNQAKVL